MPVMILQTWQFIVLALAGWLNQQQQDIVAYLSEENRVLREQFKGKRLRFTDDQRRRLAAKGKALGRKVLGEICRLVTPETLLCWYQTLIAKKYDGSAKRGPGRPRVEESIPELVVRMAKENVSWGYGRIQGALENLSHTISRSTIARILKEHGLPGTLRGDPLPRASGRVASLLPPCGVGGVTGSKAGAPRRVSPAGPIGVSSGAMLIAELFQHRL
jgi:hypothetical protein